MQEQHGSIQSNLLAPSMVLLIAIVIGAASYWAAPYVVQSSFGLDQTNTGNREPIEGYKDMIDPQTAKAYCDRALVRSFIGDNEGAIDDFNNSIKLDPENADAYFGRGLAFLDQEKNKLGLANLAKAVKYKPDDYKFHIAYGRSLMVDGQTKRALEEFAEAIRLKPDDQEAYCARGYLLGAQRDLKGALKDYESAMKVDPDDAWIPFAHGNALYDLGDKQGAIKDYDKAIAMLNDYAPVYWTRGRVRLELGDTKGAVKDLDLAVKNAPDESTAYRVRSLVRTAAGDKEGALKDTVKATKLEEEQAEREKKQKRKKKKKKFELMDDPAIYKFCADTLAQEQKIFGPAKVPIKRLFIYYRSGKNCQTVMVDEKKGLFCICMPNDKNIDVYYYSLVHELMHLLNTRIADPYIEGLCSIFPAHATPPRQRKLQIWTKKYERGVLKIPFYAETYLMMRELEDRLKIQGLSKMPSHLGYNFKERDGWMHIDADTWLETLSPEDKQFAIHTIAKYCDRIEDTLTDDGAYAFKRPKLVGKRTTPPKKKKGED